MHTYIYVYGIPVNRPAEKIYPTFPRQFIVFNEQITVIIHLNNYIILLYPYRISILHGLPGSSRGGRRDVWWAYMYKHFVVLCARNVCVCVCVCSRVSIVIMYIVHIYVQVDTHDIGGVFRNFSWHRWAVGYIFNNPVKLKNLHRSGSPVPYTRNIIFYHLRPSSYHRTMQTLFDLVVFKLYVPNYSWYT